MQPKPANILLVEDNPSDIRYTQIALADLGVANQLTVVNDGEAALDYLFRKGQYKEAPRPDCVLLDWNIPKADGSEVLEIVKGDSNLSEIPVIVLSGSAVQEDVIKAYHLKADGYVTKPINLSALHTIMECCDFRILLTVNPARGDSAR